MRAMRRRWTMERERGTSLVELSITMLIMGVVVAATATLVIGAQQTNTQTTNRGDQIQEARNGVERMSHTLRASVMPSQLLSACAGCTEDAFIRGEAYEVQFYANIDNPGNSVGPSRVTYEIAETAPGVGNLVQTVQIPNSPIPTSSGYVYCNPVTDTSPACQARVSSQIIARGVLVDASRPLLSYYDLTGAELVPASGALTSEQLRLVLAIEVHLKVQTQGSNRPQPTEYVQRIMLPNAQAIIRAGEEESTP